MPTRAQLTQDRSRLRRDELLAATIELFAEGGSRAVTHRAVAKRAGLPPATTTYYFASIDDLLREALADHIRQWTSDLTALIGLDIGGTFDLDDVTDLVGRVFRERGPEVAAVELSIYLAATKDPALRDSATESLVLFESLVVRVLSRLGLDGADEVGASIIALIAGTALRRQSGQYTEDQEARLLAAAVRTLIAAHQHG